MSKSEHVYLAIVLAVLLGVTGTMLYSQLTSAKASAWRIGCMDSGKMSPEQCRQAERIFNR